MSDRIPTRKLWDYMINIKKEFVPRKKRYIYYQEKSRRRCMSLYLNMLRSMLPGCSMEKGKGYDNTIGYAIVVSVSTSYSRCYNLALS